MLVGSERSFLINGCECGIRGDGRGHLDWRPVSIDTSIVASASGSARVQIGATDVIVGVKVAL
jgi:exosome complex component RRP42